MKRLLALILTLSVLLSGCSLSNRNIKEPVEFFYPRVCTRPDEYKAYFSEGSVGSESREASGHRNDLYYLLSMYLRGPMDPQLASPFPSGCAVVKVQQDETILTVNLNASAAGVTDMDLTLAWACLAKTCLGLTDADTVHIESRGIDNKLLFRYTVTADTLLWEDALPPATDVPENTQ